MIILVKVEREKARKRGALTEVQKQMCGDYSKVTGKYSLNIWLLLTSNKKDKNKIRKCFWVFLNFQLFIFYLIFIAFFP